VQTDEGQLITYIDVDGNDGKVSNYQMLTKEEIE